MFINLFSAQVRQDPYSTYAELRRNGSVHHDQRRDLWLVGRYSDVARALAEPETFSNRGASIETRLLGADSTAHVRVRNIVKRAFTSARISALEPLIRSIVHELVERVRTRGECELINDLAAPLPMSVIAWLLGIEFARLHDLRRWAAAILRVGAASTEEERRKTAEENFECLKFLTDHIDRSPGEPGRGCVAEFLAGHGGGDRLTPDEMLDIAFLLLVAGTETTTNLIGNAGLLLTRDPTLQSCLRTGADLISPFIEEVLRYETPVQRRPRVTTCSTQIGTVRLPKGARVQLLIGSANRDPEKFPDADRFCIERRPNHHLAFGLGPHFCLGAQLARLEASIAVETLVKRLPGFVRARPGENIDYGTSFTIRGPKRLELGIALPDAQHDASTKEVVRS
jgi:cytochrome P450